MQSEGTLLLQRSDVAQLLTLTECIDAVERVFRWQGEGKIPAAGILGVKAAGGGLHVKACHLPGNRSYLVAKLNTNFSDNPRHRRLPTIQGVIVLCDAESGYPLAIVDSTDITTKRTAAASAVAAKYLARSDSSVATICGCGKQGYAQLQALLAIFRLKKVYLFDLDEQAIKNFASALRSQKELEVKPVYDLSEALRTSDICVTCTPSRQFFVRKKDVSPGSFIAAIGADAEDKQEIDPELMASSKVVVDSLDQCCVLGDLHHAISHGLMRRENAYAELSEVVAGKKCGRTGDEEIIVFDSTGVAIEDAIAVAIVYEKARAVNNEIFFHFAA